MIMQHCVLKQTGTKLLYAVIPASSITQRVCVCPQWNLWRQNKLQHFLVNDMLEQPTQLKTWAARSLPMFNKL